MISPQRVYRLVALKFGNYTSKPLMYAEYNRQICDDCVLQVEVTDVNDNCPILNISNLVLEPIPALGNTSMIVCNASDADTGLNAQVMYMASTPQVE